MARVIQFGASPFMMGAGAAAGARANHYQRLMAMEAERQKQRRASAQQGIQQLNKSLQTVISYQQQQEQQEALATRQRAAQQAMAERQQQTWTNQQYELGYTDADRRGLGELESTESWARANSDGFLSEFEQQTVLQEVERRRAAIQPQRRLKSEAAVQREAAIQQSLFYYTIPGTNERILVRRGRYGLEPVKLPEGGRSEFEDLWDEAQGRLRETLDPSVKISTEQMRTTVAEIVAERREKEQQLTYLKMSAEGPDGPAKADEWLAEVQRQEFMEFRDQVTRGGGGVPWKRPTDPMPSVTPPPRQGIQPGGTWQMMAGIPSPLPERREDMVVGSLYGPIPDAAGDLWIWRWDGEHLVPVARASEYLPASP